METLVVKFFLFGWRVKNWYHPKSRWRNSHVLVYHGHLLIHLEWVAPPLSLQRKCLERLYVDHDIGFKMLCKRIGGYLSQLLLSHALLGFKEIICVHIYIYVCVHEQPRHLPSYDSPRNSRSSSHKIETHFRRIGISIRATNEKPLLSIILVVW